MIRRTSLLTILSSLLIFSDLPAQGFNLISGRNHPEIEWQVAETPHFLIAYPARLSGIENAAAAIAEETYAALSKNLGTEFSRKIRVYLSDEDEIANGFAVNIGTGHTNIWVHVNDAAAGWSTEEKWLRTVLSHEIAHIFHYQATQSRLGLLAYLVANPLPRFWTEGLAQYQTEQWNAFRGDQYLRTATLEGRLNYDDGSSIWNGNLLYASGHAQLRYLTEQYGDSTLEAILRHRTPALFGLVRVHDFPRAFRAVVGQSYREFNDEWRRHIGVYYNTIAGQMETADSLGSEFALPDQYYVDLKHNPDTNLIAVLAIPSLKEPIRTLVTIDTRTQTRTVVAEGRINDGFSFSPDGRQIAFSRLARGEHGSLLNDLFIVDADGNNERRLTFSRRAMFPSFNPSGDTLAFVGSEGGTANIFLMDLSTGTEWQLTDFEGDVQIGRIAWQPGGSQIAFYHFSENGTRSIRLVDSQNGDSRQVTDGTWDDRTPIWSPAGDHLVFTSLRDDVPNVFILDVGSERPNPERVTGVATGARATDWMPSDSLHQQGRLLVFSRNSKHQDAAYRIPATRRVSDVTYSVPEEYATWTDSSPPRTIPSAIDPNSNLVLSRRPYNSWRNITHVVSLAVPYYWSGTNWGVAGLTTWTEPLGKHSLSLLAALSVPDGGSSSIIFGSYLNNQLRPSIMVSGYHLPGTARFYGDAVLIEQLTGGDVTARLPLDLVDRPFLSTDVSGRFRFARIEPLRLDAFEELPPDLARPESGTQTDVQATFTIRHLPPHRHNVIHPLRGTGARMRITAAGRVLGSDREFFRPDLAAYTIIPGLGQQRLYLYGRAQVQFGRPLAQDYIGLSRQDDITLPLLDVFPISWGDSERVRGYREYALGDRLLFGTVEYRVPFLTDLRTRLLGVLSLGGTTLAAFTDGALVWSQGNFSGAERRIGFGVEVKNVVRLGNISILHALGLARPASEFRGPSYDLYYRVRTTIPF